MTLNEICKALECCSTEATDNAFETCEGCPYDEHNKLSGCSCIRQMCNDAVELIKKQQEKIEELKIIKQLNEQDIAERDEMLKQKVEVVYEDFMKDYKCILEENEGIYEELAEARAEIERFKAYKEQLKERTKGILLDEQTIAEIIDEVFRSKMTP